MSSYAPDTRQEAVMGDSTLHILKIGAHYTMAGLTIDLQLFAIDNFPAVISGVIEQTGYLERLFLDELNAQLAYRMVADKDPVPNGVGETITRSRPSLLPTATTPLNPANNTGLDNGLTATPYTFEQYQLAINMYAATLNLSLEQNKTLIASLFQKNVQQLAKQAAQTLDSLCAQFMHKAYDSGNTFARTAASAQTTIAVDNGFGFDTQFSTVANTSPGLPQPVSASNKLPIQILDGSTGAVKASVNVTGCAFDGTNVSTAFAGGIAYGASAVLTVDASVTCAIGDRIVAMNNNSGSTFNSVQADGAFVLRPGNRQTRYQLASSDTLNLALCATAAAKLAARGVPRLSNGLYGCIVDPVVLAQLYSDNQFQVATQGSFDRSPVFKNGVIAEAVGLEFVPSTSVPAYSTGNSNVPFARHAVVVGEGALVEGPFAGSPEAAREAASMGLSDIRIMDWIIMITRPGLDRMADNIAQTWKYTGAFAAPTDKTSDPTKIPTTDYARYKRAAVIEVASSI